MKYLLLLAIIVAILFIAKRGRSGARKADAQPRGGAQPTGKAQTEQEALLACAHCGVHLPVAETLPGRGGVFCGEAHRSAFEQAHPL